MDRRRAVKTRRARELDMAFGMTVFFGLSSVVFIAGGGLNGRQSPLLVIAFGILTALAWWWAVRTIMARNAAGKTIEQMQALSPEQFEEWVGARFRDLGYKVKVTGMGGDHGIDLIAEKEGEVAVIQCKNYKSWSVGEPVLRDLYGAMHHFEATKAYLVTTGRLTKAAVGWVEGKPIEVWDGERLVELSMRLAKEHDNGRGAENTAAVAPPAALADDTPEMPDGSEPTCPQCGSLLVKRKNRRTGETFLACPRYPQCRHTQPLTSASS